MDHPTTRPRRCVAGFAAPVTLESVATIDLGDQGSLATAADVSLDGYVIAVRTYSHVLMFTRPHGSPFEAAFATPPCVAPSTLEQQGEAIAFAGADGYVTISEGGHPPVNRFQTVGCRGVLVNLPGDR